MSIVYIGSTSASVDAAATIDIDVPATSDVGDFLAIAVAFEGRASGSGPWVKPWETGDPSTVIGEATDWKQILYQAPSATGSGLEIWAAIIVGAGATDEPTTVNFTGSYAAAAGMVSYSGAYGSHILDGAVRAFAKQQWTGDNPEAPSVYAYDRELLIACSALELDSPGYGDPTPDGWDTKVDKARADTFGNVELAMASKITVIEGATGAIPWAATSDTGSDKGATATLAVRPVTTAPAATSPLIAVEYAVPL